MASFFKKIARVFKPVAKAVGAILPIFVPAAAPAVAAISALSRAPAVQAVQTAVQAFRGNGALPQPALGNVGAGIPNLLETVSMIFPSNPLTSPFFQPAGLPVVAGVAALTAGVIGAIGKLARVMGVNVTVTNIARVGRRLWASLNTFARAHPGINIAAFLGGLGLSALEVGEFLAWGSQRKRRRRRGLSWSDLRRTRRTLRILRSMEAQLGGGRRAPSRRRPGGASTIIAQN